MLDVINKLLKLRRGCQEERGCERKRGERTNDEEQLAVDRPMAWLVVNVLHVHFSINGQTFTEWMDVSTSVLHPALKAICFTQIG